VIRSMTGFAAVTRADAETSAHVTVKSVNHRFLDVVVKGPQSLAEAEGRIKSAAQQRLARGRVDVMIALDYVGTPARDVQLDEALLAKVAQAFESARQKGLVAGMLTPTDVLRLPQALDIRTVGAEPGGLASDRVVALVERAAADALDALVVMRETEGGYLAADVEARLVTLAGFVDDLERMAREGQAELESRLRDRLESLPADLRGEPAAVAQEIVRFASRSDIDEEVVRMRGHLQHWRTLAGSQEPCGRKLDFLVQEMNREINTMGSKAEGARVTETVIAAKAELERIREQIQNVE
jgi:uncharacterized protein (TIGR00255 family)